MWSTAGAPSTSSTDDQESNGMFEKIEQRIADIERGFALREPPWDGEVCLTESLPARLMQKVLQRGRGGRQTEAEAEAEAEDRDRQADMQRTEGRGRQAEAERGQRQRQTCRVRRGRGRGRQTERGQRQSRQKRTPIDVILSLPETNHHARFPALAGFCGLVKISDDETFKEQGYVGPPPSETFSVQGKGLSDIGRSRDDDSRGAAAGSSSKAVAAGAQQAFSLDRCPPSMCLLRGGRDLCRRPRASFSAFAAPLYCRGGRFCC